jgi:transcriptional regulator with XRE-family HTH domain
LKITQPDLAQVANVSVNTLYKIERGQANPTLDVIEKIADVLGLELRIEAKKVIL